jgi:hypothetical protein
MCMWHDDFDHAVDITMIGERLGRELGVGVQPLPEPMRELLLRIADAEGGMP